MTSPTPPDFFAENANKSEHHAESAYCSDHIVDANKMVPAGLPSEDEMTMLIDGAAYYGADSRSVARAILALIRPAFEAKEREIERWQQHSSETEAELQAAEAKFAQAVEALVRAKDEIVRTADDLSMHSPAVKLIEEIVAIIGQPALNSRAIVREAARSAAAMGEKT